MLGSRELEFRKTVLSNANNECENPRCNADADHIHHMLKRSVYSKSITDPTVCIALCGNCHTIVERLQLEKGPWEFLYPIDKYRKALAKYGIDYWLNFHVASIMKVIVYVVAGYDTHKRSIRATIDYHDWCKFFVGTAQLFEFEIPGNSGLYAELEIRGIKVIEELEGR